MWIDIGMSQSKRNDKVQKRLGLVIVNDVSDRGGRVNLGSMTMGSRGCALPDWAHWYTSHPGTTFIHHGND